MCAANPCFHVLLKDLLRAETFSDHNDGAFREQVGQKHRKKRLGFPD